MHFALILAHYLPFQSRTGMRRNLIVITPDQVGVTSRISSNFILLACNQTSYTFAYIISSSIFHRHFCTNTAVLLSPPSINRTQLTAATTYFATLAAPDSHCTLCRTKVSVRRKQTPWPLVRTRTIPTERPPLIGEI
jgi:hypothetical protein